MPCKERLEAPRYRVWLYRSLYREFWRWESEKTGRSGDLGNEAQRRFRAVLARREGLALLCLFLAPRYSRGSALSRRHNRVPRWFMQLSPTHAPWPSSAILTPARTSF